MKSDEKFLTYVIKRLKKQNWDLNDIKFLYYKFLYFINEENLNEISLLRYGETLAGKTLDTINYNDINNVKTKIYLVLDNMEKLSIPVMTNIIAVILKLTLEKYKEEKL